MMRNEPILVVEDSDEDFEVITWAFRELAVMHPVQRAVRGEEVIEQLLSEGEASAQRPLPALLLLDLNLPGMGGREVLQQVRTHESTRLVPVVVLSTSNNPRDIEACYRLGASGYVCKPLQLDSFVERIGGVVTYWLRTVMHPLDRT